MPLSSRSERPLIHVRGILGLFAVWFYFLIFAQFAFLAWVDAVQATAYQRAIMGAMGAAGLLSGLGAVPLLGRLGTPAVMRMGFGVCALAAMVMPLVHTPLLLAGLGALIGLGLGALTVAMASGLTELCGTRGLGLQVGLGAGLAYFCCNLPVVFNADPTAQAHMAGVVCLAGLLSNLRPAPYEASDLGAPLPGGKFLGFAAPVAALTLLVWMDSGLFYIFQHTPDMKAATWEGARLWVNGAAHLVFAAAAGYWVDRGAYWGVLLGACGLLCGGTLLLAAGQPAASFFYAAGVSLYSTVLVAWPSLHRADPHTRRLRTGLLYGIAGWLGSALGIGMVQDLHRIPLWFLVAGAGVVLGSRLLSLRLARSAAGLTAAALLIPALSVLTGCGARADVPAAAHVPDSARGLQVYLGEGCINCHSRYVRPGTPDEEWWGPTRDMETLRAARPALFGNRRQGPDLLNVGNRRDVAWQRVHLRDPQMLHPGSSMPSYAHLFDDDRAEDLIAWLQQQGMQDVDARLETVRAWRPDPAARSVSMHEAQALYRASCTGCHGARGLGNGPAAGMLSGPVRNLRHDPFLYAAEDDTEALARVIKFGLLGTSMPGHETLNDAQLLGLVDLVRTWRVRP